jgi:hypothetical protein
LTKSVKEGWCFGLLTVISRRWNGVDVPEVSQEKVRTSYQTMSVTATVGRTPASWQVALEAVNLGVIHLGKRDMLALSPMDQVLSCPDMAASRDLSVASLPERVSEPVHEGPQWTDAQLFNEVFGLVVVDEHGVLLMSEFWSFHDTEDVKIMRSVLSQEHASKTPAGGLIDSINANYSA